MEALRHGPGQFKLRDEYMISCYNRHVLVCYPLKPMEAHRASIVQFKHKFKKKDGEDLVLRFLLPTNMSY